MKILHTADWHVGAGVRGLSRDAEHEAVLEEIASLADERDVELVLVSGDLFESAAPSASAERIVYSALLRLARGGRPVVAIAGNHDNMARLQAVAPILAFAGVTVLADPVALPDQAVISLTARSGCDVRIVAIPWVSQRHIVRITQLMQDDFAGFKQEYADQMRRLIGYYCTRFDPACVNVIVGHVMMPDAKLSDTERTPHVVYGYYVPAQHLPENTQYAALGHVHRPQRIPGGMPIHYAGSPLQIDFGEEGQEKSVCIVDVEPGLPASVECVPLSAGRRFRTLTGSLDELEALSDGVGDDYLRVRVREPRRAGLAERVRELLPNAVWVEMAEATPRKDERSPIDLSELHTRPESFFQEYLKEREITDERLLELFRKLREEQYATDPT